MKTGVYRIRNINNNDCYVGSAKDIDKRWYRHKYDLNRNKHGNEHLQRAWNKYGENLYVFEIIEECQTILLLEREQHYLDLKPKYNIGLKSSGGDNLTNNPNREKIIKRISDSNKIRCSKISKEEHVKIHSKPKEKNSNWKGGVSVKYCECGNKMGYSAKTCMKCRDTKSEKNSFYGKHHTDKNKNYYSELFKGKCLHRNEKPLSIDNVKFKSLKEASDKLGIGYLTIRWRVLSKNVKFINYKYIK